MIASIFELDFLKSTNKPEYECSKKGAYYYQNGEFKHLPAEHYFGSMWSVTAPLVPSGELRDDLKIEKALFELLETVPFTESIHPLFNPYYVVPKGDSLFLLPKSGHCYTNVMKKGFACYLVRYLEDVKRIPIYHHFKFDFNSCHQQTQ